MQHSHQQHRERRVRLIAEMRAQSGGGIAAIPTAPEAIRNADTHYPYRADSHFHYLCGFPEPEAVVVGGEGDGWVVGDGGWIVGAGGHAFPNA